VHFIAAIVTIKQAGLPMILHCYSKGITSSRDGVATADKLHQIIVDASAFGEGQEQHTLPAILELIAERYQRLGICDDVFKETIVTADTGFASEANMAYLHEHQINAYISDNQFRLRDPKFQTRKDDHPNWTRQDRPLNPTTPAGEFTFDPTDNSCVCPAGKPMRLRQVKEDRVFFEGRLLNCRHCGQKSRCMRHPESADHRKGHGRQVSLLLNDKRKPTYTDWMKHRVDSDQDKQVYGHRMAVIEPVFGNIGHNKGLTRFSLRTKAKVQGQWQMYCLVHNIEKLQNYGNIAA
jgi:hypothetical protein